MGFQIVSNEVPSIPEPTVYEEELKGMLDDYVDDYIYGDLEDNNRDILIHLADQLDQLVNNEQEPEDD